MNQQQWREFLNKSSLTSTDWGDAKEHSNWWCTCAIGSFEYDDSSFIPSYGDNDEDFLEAHAAASPIYGTDKYTLGMEFNDAIDAQQQEKALEIYYQLSVIYS